MKQNIRSAKRRNVFETISMSLFYCIAEWGSREVKAWFIFALPRHIKCVMGKKTILPNKGPAINS